MRNTIISENGTVFSIKDYVNGFEYKRGSASETPNLMQFPFSEGRVLVNNSNSFNYEYFMKDHLGNTRVSFNESAVVQQTNFYYPFGIRITGSVPGDENKYLYNGKELFDDNGLYWYHYGARFYNPQIGQWHTMDPADEFNSPYVYVGNNPIMLTDPDGRQAFGINWTEFGIAAYVLLDSWFGEAARAEYFEIDKLTSRMNGGTNYENKPLELNFNNKLNFNMPGNTYLALSTSKQSSYTDMSGFVNFSLKLNESGISTSIGGDIVFSPPSLGPNNLSMELGFSNSSDLSGWSKSYSAGLLGFGVIVSQPISANPIYGPYTSGGIIISNSPMWIGVSGEYTTKPIGF